ncbi:non-ribosomal peptide synthetase [Enterococcus quebecensis]|uniref:Non-ribosomal peptide synthetase n=1 Tax=Enterococcus quebecensis TaxID=903983 RepID=A0A1E5GUA6_9ENTE|nr:non-ribosomal peptide synthetase [Enterococcus quebecensis]OEG16249.1 non-ribosomal peptide synthetase [Enterococcus quebecensis]OJG74477.1 amino acid adenylation domain-containing protein [Enterococcus quebecensis]
MNNKIEKQANPTIDYSQLNLIEVFKENVMTHSEQLAVSDKKSSLTYKELDQRSEVLAAVITDKMKDSISPFVGIFMEKKIAAIIGLIAILKAGYAYVPLDNSYPKKHLQSLVEDSKIDLILGHKESLSLAGSLVSQSIDLEDFDNDNVGAADIGRVISPTDLAYLIYTSGTTGKAKGVMVEHRNIVNLVKKSNYCSFEDISILQMGSLSFDASTFEIFGALLNGGTVHLADKSILGDVIAFRDSIEKYKINTLFITTALFNQLVDIDPEIFNSLKQLFVGGDSISAVHVQKCLDKKDNNFKLYNIYGPTETTTFALFYQIQKEKTDKIPIGRPISQVEVYIFSDENLETEVLEGELYIGGAGVARGYLNREELTQQKFIDHPTKVGERLYRTGDLVRKNKDGMIEYLGRIDNQIKLRGFRIELDGIESLIREVPGVNDAVVILRNDSGRKNICAYILTNKKITEEEVKSWLREYLSEYMIPTFVITMEQFPLTINGKVDKKNLPSPDRQVTAGNNQPKTQRETCIAEVFTEVLGIGKIDVTINFFDYGGDSIKAIRMVSLLRSKGFDISVEGIIKGQTVEKIALYLEEIKDEAINQEEVIGQVQITPIQKQFFEKKLKRPNHFNQSVLFESHLRLEPEIISESLLTIVQHHDMLRAIYPSNDEQIIKVSSLFTKDDFNVELIELGEGDPEIEIASIERRIQEQLDLSSGQLLKAAIFRGEFEDYLLLCIHHLVVDGISWRIIAEDLNTCYLNRKNGGNFCLPKKTNSFKNWSFELEKYRDSEQLIKETRYWKQVDKDIHSGLVLPERKSDRGRTKVVSFQLDSVVTQNLLMNANQTYNTEINDLLLTALYRTINRLTGKSDLAVLMEGHGRESIGKKFPIDRTVGWFTTIYPVTIKSIGRSLQEDICNTKETFRKIPNHGFGYSVLKCYGEKELSQIEPDITFNYLGDFSEENSNHLLKIKQTDYGEQVAEINSFSSPLVVDCVVIDQNLNISLLYDEEWISEEFINSLQQLYTIEMKELVTHCVEANEIIETPSDKGELAWSLKEFRKVEEHFSKKNQRIKRLYPLTSTQEGMLFHKLNEPDSTMYFIQNTYDIEGIIDIELLRKALELLSKKHPVLRTSIIYKEVNEFRQGIIEGRKPKLLYKDISEHKDSEILIAKLCLEDIQQSFDLQEDSLIRGQLIKYSVDKYKLVLSYHHIILDGWCTSIMIDDLLLYYKELQKNDGSTSKIQICEETETFEDFVRLIREKDQEHALAYWGNVLEGYENQASFEPEMKSTELKTGQVISRKISDAEFHKLETFSRKNSVTLNTVLETAWGLLLQQYTNQQDVVFGKIVSGRNVPLNTVNEMLGMFINTIPIRIKIEQDQTVSNMLTMVQNQALESMNYDYCALSDIQKEAGQIDNLVATLIGFENFSEKKIESPETFTMTFDGLREETNYDLSLDIVGNGYLEFRLLYNSQLYSQQYCERVIDRLEMLLAAILADPEKKVSRLEMLTIEEKELVLERFNSQARKRLANQTIIELFEETVKKYPNRVAVKIDDQKLTYHELNSWANALGEKLREMGAESNQLVGIVADRSLEMIAGIFGILKSGAGYLPLDPEFPKERIQYMLQDSGTKLIVSHSSLEFDLPVVAISEYRNREKGNLEKKSISTDLVYSIYTSGTSGKPKGVLVEQRHLFNLVTWQRDFMELSEKTEVLQFFNYIFDGSVWEIFATLLNGASLLLINEEEKNDLGCLLKLIEGRQVVIVPSLFRGIVEYAQNTKQELLFDKVYLAGEALDDDLVLQLKNLVGNRINQIYNLYGPTECTVCATYYNLGDMGDSGKVLIGKAIENTQLYVLNDKQLCGIGIPGELCIGGDSVTRGYLNQPELTEEKFISLPYGNEGKLYRTGDLVRWTEDGNIDYLGRIDEQVKIRGFRVELSEIENRLRALPEISDAVVAVKIVNDSKIICAYYLSELAPTSEEIRNQLSVDLPDYMIPTSIVQLKEFPRSHAGKLDRKALPQPMLESTSEFILPTTEAEKAVIQIFKEVLRTDKEISAVDDFFALGGDSIKAIRIVSYLRELGYSGNVSIIMGQRTPKKIASLIRLDDKNNIDQSEVVGIVPFTAIQKAFIEHEGKEKNHFNQSVLLQIPSRLNEVAMKQTMDELKKHHDMLRAKFTKDQQFVLSVEECSDVEIEVYDLTSYTEEQAEIEIDSISEQLQSSIELSNGSPITVGIFRLKTIDYLLIAIHHLVIDGVSWRILIEDLKYVYNSLINDKVIDLPEKTHSFKEWSLAVSEYSRSERIGREISYWQKIEQNVAGGYLQLDNISDDEETLNEATVLTLTEEQTDLLLKKSSLAYNTEINDLLLTALGRSVYRLTGQTKVAVQMEGHGRENIDPNIQIDRTVGWFTSTYPIVMDKLEGDIPEMICSVKEMLRRIPMHGIGYGILTELSNAPLDKVIPDLTFNYLGEFHFSKKNEDFSESHIAHGRDVSSEDSFHTKLSLDGGVNEGKLQITMTYKDSGYSDQQMIEFRDILKAELLAIISHCTDQKEIWKTPSDFGELVWEQEEFEKISLFYKELGCEIERISPLTSTQEGMLFHKLYDDKSSAYVVQYVNTVEGLGSLEYLQLSLELLQQKHGILETNIAYHGVSEPRIVLLKGRPIEFTEIHLSRKAKSEREDILNADVERGFNLAKDSLFRVIVLHHENGKTELVLTFHHIIMDGWCTSILINDLNQFYSELASGKTKEQLKRELTTRYDYDNFVRQEADCSKNQMRDYWKGKLEGYDQPAVIQQQNNNNKEETTDVLVTQQALNKEETKALERLCKENSTTINSLLETAWGILLQKYSGTTDVVFGKIVSGRDAVAKNIETTVGLFINTIPVRIVADSDQTIKGLLSKVQEQAIESSRYDSFSLSDIQTECTDLGKELIHSIVVFENYAEQESKDNYVLQLTTNEVREQTSYDLTLVGYKKEKLILELLVNANTYTKEESTRILSQVIAIIRSILNDSSQLVSQLNVITQKERGLIVNQFSGYDPNWKINNSVTELFEIQVQRHPNQIAISDYKQKLTYKELNRKANQVASLLMSNGIGKNNIVGIMAERTADSIVAMLAVLKAGAAYLPIDPEYPRKRIEYIIADSKMSCVLYPSMEDHISLESVVNVIELSKLPLWEKAANTQSVKCSAEDMACIIYTSGTTGNPKGTIVPHQGIVRLVKDTNYVDFSDIVTIQMGSLSFDAAHFEIWGPLVNGGRVYIGEKELLSSVERLEEVLEKQKINTMFITTALFNQYVELNPHLFNHLTQLYFGGEATSVGHVRQFLENKADSLRLYNVYGPTEATTFTLFYEIPNKESIGEIVPIGKPIANTGVLVLSQGTVCGIGMPGELCISGPGLALGYLNNKELTSEKFQDSLAFSEENAKIYRTGDLVKWTAEGDLIYLGRMDNQVKLNGYRIELNEIENVLRCIDGVKNALVRLNQKNGFNYLSAYLITTDKLDVDRIKINLMEKLPEFMIPQSFVFMEQFPITINGKIDMKALPEVEFNVREKELILPRDSWEQQIYDHFSTVFGTERFCVTDSFFDIGGNSLKAIRLINLLEMNLKIRLSLEELFMLETVEQIAKKTKGRSSQLDEEDYYVSLSDFLD